MPDHPDEKNKLLTWKCPKCKRSLQANDVWANEGGRIFFFECENCEWIVTWRGGQSPFGFVFLVEEKAEVVNGEKVLSFRERWGEEPGMTIEEVDEGVEEQMDHVIDRLREMGREDEIPAYVRDSPEYKRKYGKS